MSTQKSFQIHKLLTIGIGSAVILVFSGGKAEAIPLEEVIRRVAPVALDAFLNGASRQEDSFDQSVTGFQELTPGLEGQGQEPLSSPLYSAPALQPYQPAQPGFFSPPSSYPVPGYPSPQAVPQPYPQFYPPVAPGFAPMPAYPSGYPSMYPGYPPQQYIQPVNRQPVIIIN